jgi:hypothetical protein
MRHPADGTLRRLLDDPAGVADHDRRHLADCPTCQVALAMTEDDAALAASVLTIDPPDAHHDSHPDARDVGDIDVDLAWQRLSAALADGRATTASAPRARRWRSPLRRPAVAAFGVAALLSGAGVAAAADWLPIFRTERIEPVLLDQRALLQLPDLSEYGTLEIVEEVEMTRVAGAAAAGAATGLDVPTVAELPHGVVGDPEYHIGSRAVAEFTFSAEEAGATTAADGAVLPEPPPGLDGSQFRLVAGPGLAAVWTEARGVPALVVGRAVAPTGYSSGVPFETARDYLLRLPGLPDEVAAQLRTFSADGTTLPLPIGDPDGSVVTSDADVNGAPATVIELGDGSIAGVIWVADGVVTVVAGLLSVDEVLGVARGFR